MDARSLASGQLAVELPTATRWECGVCWAIYDPAEGDAVWQIPVGTAFAALPAHWTCPVCSAERHKFLPLDAA